MVHWPGDPPFHIERAFDRDKGDAATVSQMTLGVYPGTRMDAPLHYIRNGRTPSQFVKDFQTPTLGIQGELDFRVPYKQSLELYTSLQMRRIPSRLLIFPQGHWVLKPQNSALWYKTFLDWVGNWTKK